MHGGKSRVRWDNKTVEQESCKENTQGRSCKVNGLSSCLLAYLILASFIPNSSVSFGLTSLPSFTSMSLSLRLRSDPRRK